MLDAVSVLLLWPNKTRIITLMNTLGSGRGLHFAWLRVSRLTENTRASPTTRDGTCQSSDEPGTNFSRHMQNKVTHRSAHRRYLPELRITGVIF